MKKILSLFIVAFLLMLLLVRFWPQSEPKTQASAKIKGEIFILEIADSPQKWARGLSGRQDLAGNEGLLFIFPDYQIRSFWMKDMNFAIDILWLQDKEIVGFAKNVLPPPLDTSDSELQSYLSPQPVNLVLEVIAGTVDRINIEKGDIIEFEQIPIAI